MDALRRLVSTPPTRNAKLPCCSVSASTLGCAQPLIATMHGGRLLPTTSPRCQRKLASSRPPSRPRAATHCRSVSCRSQPARPRCHAACQLKLPLRPPRHLHADECHDAFRTKLRLFGMWRWSARDLSA
eukprot:3709756-Prymnesium_polylepis.1